MYNLEQAEAKLRKAEENQAKASWEVTEARRMIEEAQREAAKSKWPGLSVGDRYWVMNSRNTGYNPEKLRWNNDSGDQNRAKSGQIFTTEPECQHFCDMLNYQLLVRGKALQMDGLVGYGKNTASEAHTLYDGAYSFSHRAVSNYSEQQPCVPLLTSKCAEQLASDSEIRAAAKKARNK